ncbi:MAG: two-component system sensor histidine kinase CreC [bacterium]|nr:two-component system sensor histidine kinase CreC [bacterium]
MKISYRIFLGFALILAAGFYFMTSWFMDDIKIQPKKAMEESLVDTANIMAAYLEQCVEDGQISTAQLEVFMESAGKREFSARIYELVKKKTSLNVYVTDASGKVIYDSSGFATGLDYSRKNDVYLTLKDKYGARTTRSNPKDPLSSIAYISAPVRHKGKIIGVCAIAKPWKSNNSFIETTQRKIFTGGLIAFAVALIFSFLIAHRITHPISLLKKYADSVREGKRAYPPELGKGEIKELSDAFEAMRDSLEGKKYIEKYVQTLTHQLKGPLSAIRGAAELLHEDIPENDRRKFISNIENESRRIQRIVDRVLELAAIEQQRELRNVELMDLSAMVKDIAATLSLTIHRKKIALTLETGTGIKVKGERFLLHQAIYNLVQNAVDFTPSGGSIEVEIKEHFGRLFVVVRDTGAGIPDYAGDKVFDKFYSLQRPDTGKKSSGLGLSLVREVAELHGGDVVIKANSPKGTAAVLKLPLPAG